MKQKQLDPAIAELESLAESLGRTTQAVMVYEQAAGLADALGDLDTAFRLREDLMNAATFSGHPERTITALSWCIGQSDADPARFPPERVLWQYKWLVHNLPEFFSVPSTAIEAALDDLEQRYVRSGWGRRGALKMRLVAALSMGQFERAAAVFEDWSRAPRDRGTDCNACDQNDTVRYWLAQRRDDDALSAARPLLKGKLTCATVPQSTYGQVLAPLLRGGRPLEAATFHQRGVEMMGDGADLLDTFSKHVTFLHATHNLEAARALLQRRLAVAISVPCPSDRFFVFAAAAKLLARLADTGHEGPALVLPSPLRESVADDAASLARYFMTEARTLAEKFDRRNGNRHYSDHLNRPIEYTPERVSL